MLFFNGPSPGFNHPYCAELSCPRSYRSRSVSLQLTRVKTDLRWWCGLQWMRITGETNLLVNLLGNCMYLSSQVKSCMALLVFFILVNMKCPLFANLINLDDTVKSHPTFCSMNILFNSEMHLIMESKCIWHFMLTIIAYQKLFSRTGLWSQTPKKYSGLCSHMTQVCILNDTGNSPNHFFF